MDLATPNPQGPHVRLSRRMTSAMLIEIHLRRRCDTDSSGLGFEPKQVSGDGDDVGLHIGGQHDVVIYRQVKFLPPKRCRSICCRSICQGQTQTSTCFRRRRWSLVSTGHSGG